MHQTAGLRLNRADADSLTWLAAVAVAGLAFALTFGGSVFSASVSDTSGYVSAAKGLIDDELVRPAPLQLIPSITGLHVPTSPLAYVPGPAAGTEVPVYPLGLPYLMAATETVLGPRAAFAVTPLSLAMLAFLAFLLARDAAGNAAGIGAAVLVVADPAALLNAVWGMSDVPAAACWIAAWYFALRDTRSSAITAGCLCALGSTIRPILGPLAVVIGCQCLLSNAPVGVPSRWNWGRCGAFLCVAIAGPLLVAWSQSALYGNPFRSGYPAGIAMFGLAYVGQNLRNYPHLFIDVHGPGLSATLVAGLAFVLSPSPIGRLVRTGIPLAVANCALYAIYLPYDSWPFLRFLLPATTVIFVIASAGLAGLIGRFPSNARLSPLRWVVIALPLLTIVNAQENYRFVAAEPLTHAKTPVMGAYLDAVLPRNAIVLSFIHSGAVAHYTGRTVLRPEHIAGQQLDELVSTLTSNGWHPVFVLDENVEIPAFKSIFTGSSFGMLDWPPRAEFVSDTKILYYSATDRLRHSTGEVWPTDIVRVRQ